jgi:aspartate/glutamate racemase
MRKVADQVRAGVGIPPLHIADVAALAVRRAGLGTATLLPPRSQSSRTSPATGSPRTA